MESFTARLRKVGNSLGILVPRSALDELGLGAGDDVQVTVHRSGDGRAQAFAAFAGSAPGLPRFRRDRQDRY